MSAYSADPHMFVYVYMPICLLKADPAAGWSAPMPLSSSQHGARQWATVAPSGREFPPTLSRPDPLAVRGRVDDFATLEISCVTSIGQNRKIHTFSPLGIWRQIMEV